MLGKDHITLSLFTFSIILMPFYLSGTHTGLFILALISIGIGSLAPDADSPDAAIFHNNVRGLKGDSKNIINTFIGPFLPAFSFVIKYLIYIPSIKIIQFLVSRDKVSFQYKVTKSHRGILHSFLGLIIVFFAVILYSSILSVIIPESVSLVVILVFAISFCIGFFLHLVEDSCTVSGINYTFPMSKKFVFKGKIKTGQFNYGLMAFETYLVILNVGYFFVLYILEWNLSIGLLIMESAVIILLLISWFIFMKLSNVNRIIQK